MARRIVGQSVPPDSVARLYRPVEWIGSAAGREGDCDPWNEAWLAAAAVPSIRALADGYEWPKISRFAEWNDAGREDLAEITRRVSGLMHPAIRPEAEAWAGWAPTKRLAALAVLAALGCHGRPRPHLTASGSAPADGPAVGEQVVFCPGPIVSLAERVETLALDPATWTVEATLDLAENLIKATGDSGASVGRTQRSRVLRSFDVCVARPNNTHQLGCAPGKILSELLALLRAFQSTIGPHRPTGAVAAWVFREMVKIHPLPDGNGRLARTLASALLLAGGRPCLIMTQRENLALSATLQSDSALFGTGLMRPLAALEAASIARIMGARAGAGGKG